MGKMVTVPEDIESLVLIRISDGSRSSAAIE